MSDIARALMGGVAGFAQPAVALMLAPLIALLVADACEAPQPWRPGRAGVRALRMSLGFVLGFAPAVVLIAAAFAGSSPLAGRLDLLRQIGALAITLTGLSFLATFCRPGPGWMALPRPGGLWGCWLIGVACGFNWAPAMGPALRAIVLAAAESSTGAMPLLALYALAMATPFVIAAAVLWALTTLFAQGDARSTGPGVFASAALALVGLLMLTGLWRTFIFAIMQWAPGVALLG